MRFRREYEHVAATAKDEVYKWVDDQGRVHYGDRPPAAQAPQALSDISVYAPDAAPQDGRKPATPGSARAGVPRRTDASCRLFRPARNHSSWAP